MCCSHCVHIFGLDLLINCLNIFFSITVRSAVDQLEDIFRLQTATHLEIKSTSCRIAKLEHKQQHLPVANEDENDLMAELLPLKTTDKIENFNKIIGESTITASQFVSFFLI